MSNPSRRKTRVRLVPTIHQEIEKTKCRPRPRLATRDGSEPRRGLGRPTTTSSAKGSKGPRRPHERGALFERQLQGTPVGKGGRRILPQTSGRKSGTVTASWVVAGIDRVTILSLYQSAVYNETKYLRLRLSCCNKLLTISRLPSSS